MRPFLVFLLIAAPAFPVMAADEPPPKEMPYVQVQRSLEVNRSLIARAEAEYVELSQQLATEETAKRMDDLRYKIQALKDDAARLLAELPKDTGAAEFLKDLAARRTEDGQEREPLDVEKEKRLAGKLNEIYGMHEKALALVSEERYGQAAQAYEDILLASPEDDEAYLLLGHCRMLGGEFDKARAAFLNAVHIDPANRREITGLYENVLLENPLDDQAYAHLGFAHWTLGRLEEAKKAYQSALDINPNNIEAKAGLVQIAAATS